MKKIVFAILITFAFTSLAEYRVYQYVLKNKVQNSSDEPLSQVINSSLNPQSFIAYNGGSALVSIDLIRTWVCPGYTGKMKKLCPSPYGKLPKELQ